MLLKMIALKGFVPTHADRQRILGCTSVALLERWSDRLLVARTLEEVFENS